MPGDENDDADDQPKKPSKLVKTLTDVMNLRTRKNNGESLVGRFDWTSPQWRVRRELNNEIGENHRRGDLVWDLAAFDALSAVAEEKYLEPILKLQLLRNIIVRCLRRELYPGVTAGRAKTNARIAPYERKCAVPCRP